MNWNDYKWIKRDEALKIVKSLKEAKADRAIRKEGRNVEIYAMEKHPILKERLPTYCWLVKCRDNMSASRLVDELRGVAYSF